MSPSSVPVLGAVTSSLPMASAMYGTTDKFGVWNIHDAASSGMMLTRYGMSWPICSMRYSEKVESLPPEYSEASLIGQHIDTDDKRMFFYVIHMRR